MSQPRNSPATLIVGSILVVVGTLFLVTRLVDFDFGWAWLRFALPILLLTWGLSKLIRHFLLDVGTLADRPGKAGLLSGLFWTGVGAVWLLDLLGVIPGMEFFGLYWPVLLILFGLGKIADYYRSRGRLQLRVGEVFGVIFLVLAGLGAGQVAKAQFPLISLPSLSGDHVSIDDWFSHKYSWKEEDAVDAEGLQQIEVSNLYGDVVVDGHTSKQVEVELAKEVLASDENEAKAVADQVQLTLERVEGVLKIGTNRKDVSQNRKLFKSHMHIRLPANLPLIVNNRYGDVRVNAVEAACEIKNAYGDVRVEEVTGPVRVSNQYRRITLRGVEGTVEVTNDRGAIHTEDGVGDIELATAYDSIVVRRQQGNVRLKNRFGSVSLNSVTGFAEVDSPGSEVTLSEIDGAITLSASHKPVTISSAGKGVEMQTSSNRVTLTQIAGLVKIQATYSDIRAEELEAGLQVESKGTRVSVQDLEGGFDISTSTRPVRLENFAGGGRVQNEYGEIEVISDRALDADITLSTKNAPITLVIPENTAARISAQAPGGRIQSEFTRQAEAGQELSVLDTQLAQGGPKVRLQTNYAPIFIRKSPE